jgi:hypothetical protein
MKILAEERFTLTPALSLEGEGGQSAGRSGFNRWDIHRNKD